MYSNSNEGNETGIGEYSDLSDFLNRNGLSSIYSKLKENEWTLNLLAEIDLNDISDLVNELSLPLIIKSKFKLAIKNLKNENNKQNNNLIYGNKATNIDMDLEHRKAIADLEQKVDTVTNIQSKLKQIEANQTGVIDEYNKDYIRLIQENKQLIMDCFSKAIDNYVELETNYVQTLLDEHGKVSEEIIGLNKANSLLDDYLHKDEDIQQALCDEEQKQKERSNSIIKLKTSSLQIMSNDTRERINVILKSIKPINDNLKDINGVNNQLNIINDNLDNFKNKLLKVADNIKLETQNENNNNENDKFKNLEYILNLFKSLLNKNEFELNYIKFYQNSKNENGKHELKQENLENNNNNNNDNDEKEAPENNNNNEENNENIENNQNNEGQIEESNENQQPEQPNPENEVQPPIEEPKQEPKPDPQPQPQPEQPNPPQQPN